MNFGKLITAMVTPFDKELRIDWEQTARLIDYLIEEQGSDSIVVCGTTGESATLTDEEKLQLFEFAAKHANGRCRVLAGTGSNSTAHSIELTRRAARLGVDGFLLVAPYYNRPSQEGLYQHFAAIARSTDLPVMVYNVPKRTGVHLSWETTVRLAELPNVFATKEASGDLESITRIVSGTPDDFLVYSGDDSLTLPILSVGGYGVVSVVSHVVGREMKTMIEAFASGNVAEAARIHGRLMPIFSGLFSAPSPAPVKYALSLHGLDVGGLRPPLLPLNEKEQAFIRSLFSAS